MRQHRPRCPSCASEDIFITEDRLASCVCGREWTFDDGSFDTARDNMADDREPVR